ncbi:hypothetical protein ACOSQ2_005516 [Xanthoceras sorbifolium]
MDKSVGQDPHFNHHDLTTCISEKSKKLEYENTRLDPLRVSRKPIIRSRYPNKTAEDITEPREWNYICVDLRQINAIHQSWTTWEPYNHTYKLMPSIKAGQHGSLTTIP